MSDWLRKVYVKRRDGFFHKSPSLLIYDSMRTHLTDAVNAKVNPSWTNGVPEDPSKTLVLCIFLYLPSKISIFTEYYH